MERLSKAAIRAADMACSVLLAVLSLVYFAQVICRYVFNAPVMWVDEVSGFMFVWLSFLGWAVVLAEDGHVRIDILLVRLPGRLRRLCEWISDGAILVVLIVLGYFGCQLVISGMEMRTTTLELPYGIVYSIVPIASAVMVVVLAAKCRAKLGGEKNVNSRGGN